MKKLVFLFAMVLAVSMAIAQNEAFIKQVAPDASSATVTQLGDMNQIRGVATVNDVEGTAQAAVLQISAQNPGTFDFSQVGDGNEGWIRQESWETGGGTYYEASMTWDQVGDGNIMKLNQSAKYDANVIGLQKGDGNLFAGLGNVGPNGGMTVDDSKYAVQIDAWNYARMDFTQIGDDNEVGLYQYNGRLKTELELLQKGDRNTFVGYQYNDISNNSSKNLIDVTQTGNDYHAECFQKNLGPNGGNNFAIVQ